MVDSFVLDPSGAEVVAVDYSAPSSLHMSRLLTLQSRVRAATAALTKKSRPSNKRGLLVDLLEAGTGRSDSSPLWHGCSVTVQSSQHLLLCGRPTRGSDGQTGVESCRVPIVELADYTYPGRPFRHLFFHWPIGATYRSSFSGV
jgi:hypothetical protein